MDRKVWNGYGTREVFRSTRGTERGAWGPSLGHSHGRRLACTSPLGSKRYGKNKSRCKLTIDALLGLLDESLAEGFPGQILGDAIDLGYAHTGTTKNDGVQISPFL